MSLFDLKQLLAADHPRSGEASVINYPAPSFALSEVLRSTLMDRYGLPADFRLDKMHTYVETSKIAENSEDSGHWFHPLQELGAPMVAEYHRFVGWLSEHLGFDFVFENNPIVRFHIPGRFDDRFRLGDGEIFSHHSDTMLGDYFQQVNCWLPFCDVKDTGALSVCSRETSLTTLGEFIDHHEFAYADYKGSRPQFFEYMREHPERLAVIRADTMPINMRYGQCLLFDPRTLHGTAENVSDSTRVSMDFRIIPLAAYDAIMAELDATGTAPNSYDGERLVRGEFYCADTARTAVPA